MGRTFAGGGPEITEIHLGSFNQKITLSCNYGGKGAGVRRLYRRGATDDRGVVTLGTGTWIGESKGDPSWCGHSCRLQLADDANNLRLWTTSGVVRIAPLIWKTSGLGMAVPPNL
jgi:hypothetical protein